MPRFNKRCLGERLPRASRGGGWTLRCLRIVVFHRQGPPCRGGKRDLITDFPDKRKTLSSALEARGTKIRRGIVTFRKREKNADSILHQFIFSSKTLTAVHFQNFERFVWFQKIWILVVLVVILVVKSMLNTRRTGLQYVSKYSACINRYNPNDNN